MAGDKDILVEARLLLANATQGPWRWLKAPMGDGIYWWRADEADNDPDIHFVQGEFFYQVGFASSETVANFGGEWLGPITPNSVAQMRSACIEKVKAYLTDSRDEERGIIEAIASELESLSIEKDSTTGEP